jgi:titin
MPRNWPRRGTARELTARARLRLEPLEDRVLLSVFAVINTNDSGEGSLRQAILDANDHPGPDTFIFDIPGAGVHTIRPLSPLPTVTDPLSLDATFQPGYAGSPLIELDGSQAGSNADGLTITAGGSSVRGLAIDSFAGSGIVLRTNGGDVIAANYIGTDPTGTSARGNGIGVLVDNTSDNTVGGTAAGARNLIAGNHGTGVALDGGSGNVVQGNRIGTDVSGRAALGNRFGVFVQGGSADLIGGTDAGAGNVISASTLDGINVVTGQGHVIQGNYVGTDVTGTHALGNGNDGVLVDFSSSGTLVGGAGGVGRNVVSANSQQGIYVTSGSGNVIQGNYVGTDATGAQALGNGDSGVIVGGTLNSVGGPIPGDGNLLSGNHNYGLFLSGAGHLVQGNFVGTDAAGAVAVPNGFGVGVTLSGGDTIGGTDPGAGNLISGNRTYGLRLINTNNDVVQGNRIGTDVTGTHALGNGTYGLAVEGASAIRVGGQAAEDANLIAANGVGLELNAIQTTVQGNLIGTDASGTRPLGNQVGVLVSGTDNTIGGTAGAGNVISGNQADGIELFAGSSRTLVQGNFIGTDVSGTQALGNLRGVFCLTGGTPSAARPPGPATSSPATGATAWSWTPAATWSRATWSAPTSAVKCRWATPAWGSPSPAPTTPSAGRPPGPATSSPPTRRRAWISSPAAATSSRGTSSAPTWPAPWRWATSSASRWTARPVRTPSAARRAGPATSSPATGRRASSCPPPATSSRAT